MRHVLTPSLGARVCTRRWQRLGPSRCCSCVSVRARRLDSFLLWNPEVMPGVKFWTITLGGGKQRPEAVAGPAPRSTFICLIFSVPIPHLPVLLWTSDRCNFAPYYAPALHPALPKPMLPSQMPFLHKPWSWSSLFQACGPSLLAPPPWSLPPVPCSVSYFPYFGDKISNESNLRETTSVLPRFDSELAVRQSSVVARWAEHELDCSTWTGRGGRKEDEL